ncbi:MAG: hypothetical protein U9N87_01570 [Planctomycetota bacterium]|nr:hypothetical protein [Planctomycetota bacterium]
MKNPLPRPATWIALVAHVGFAGFLAQSVAFADPPAMNPFGSRTTVRDDAVPGYVELSSNKIHYGMIHLTRDKRLKINDEKIGRQREVPLRVVTRIDCTVKKEWMERDWRFKELALDEKMYTGKQYPAREYLHEITLRDGRKIKGPLAALVYLQPGAGNAGGNATAYRPKVKTERFTLYKRDKGKPGTKLKDLVYVKSIKLGQKALEEGRRKAEKSRKVKAKKESAGGPGS